MRTFGYLVALCSLVVFFCGTSASAKDKVFSGPQIGEKITPFKVVDVIGENKGKEWEVIDRMKGKPVTIVFMHGIERSMVQFLLAIDEYGQTKKDVLNTAIVVLSNDRVESEKRLPLVIQSLRLRSATALSVDGAEGPGNYGLNKECLLTIVVAKENKVTANFALVQPGIADAPAVIAAMAKACGDESPPTAQALLAKRGGGRDMARGGATTRPATTQPSGAGAKPQLPGAAPTDAKLLALLRSFIQKGNDDATVDKMVKEVQQYVKGNPDLTRQAIDGWVRVIYLKYGTEYSQKAGQTMVDELKKQQ